VGQLQSSSGILRLAGRKKKEGGGGDKEKGGAGYDAGTCFMERYFSENTSVARTLAADTL
jgi:hypothetical protein